MLKISSRQIIKEAGPKEKKRAGGINFDYVKSLLSPVGEEVPRSAIDEALKDESKLAIGLEKLSWIESTNLDEEAKKRVDAHETFLLIVGAALTSSSIDDMRGKISNIDSYLVANHELKPGSFSIDISKLSSVDSIKELFTEKYAEAEEWVTKSKEKEESSKTSGYISNDVVHDFGDGWKVVYVPAKGEIEPFPGLPETSHDRVLEGNKNGLCLGSGLRLYQDNNGGKIYSVRDPENKPRVTIRISGNNNLTEAKGKNNNPPDVFAAIHATDWFKTVRGLVYQNSNDFRKFPPTNIDAAREAFLLDPSIPYEKMWISAWYKNGIPEIDKDVAEKLSNNNPSIFQSGLGKTHYELAKPVVIYWCNNYIDDGCSSSILFGNRTILPEHEVFKTYKKIPEMVAAVSKLSSEYPLWFFEIGLQEFPEYKEFSDIPIKKYAEASPEIFLESFSEKDWAKNYIDYAINFAIKLMGIARFMDKFKDKDFLKKDFDKYKKMAVTKEPDIVSPGYRSYYKWVSNSDILLGYNILIESSPSKFLYYMIREDSKEIISQFKEKIGDVAKDVIDKSNDDYSIYTTVNYLEQLCTSFPDIKEYVNLAAEKTIQLNPVELNFLSPIIDDDIKIRAAEAAYQNNPDDFFKKIDYSATIDYEILKLYYGKLIRFLSEENPCKIFSARLSEATKYQDDFDKAAKNIMERKPNSFLNCIFSNTSDNMKAFVKRYEKYCIISAENLIKTDPLYFLGNYSSFYDDVDFIKPYIKASAKAYAEENPEDFIGLGYYMYDYGREYYDLALEGLAEKDPAGFIAFIFDDFNPDRLNKLKKLMPTVINSAVNLDDEGTLYRAIQLSLPGRSIDLSEYLPMAATAYAKKYPDEFINYYGNGNWAASYVEIAEAKIAEKTAFAKYPQLKKLSMALSAIGLYKTIDIIW